MCGGSLTLTGVSCATLILHSLSRWLLPSSAPAWTSYGSKAGLPKCRTNSFPSSLGSEVSGQSSCGIQLHTHKSSPDWSTDTDPMIRAHFTGAASHSCLLLGEGSKRRVLLCGFFAPKGCELLSVSLVKGMSVHRLMMRCSRQGVLIWFGAGRTNHSTVLCLFFWCRFAD